MFLEILNLLIRMEKETRAKVWVSTKGGNIVFTAQKMLLNDRGNLELFSVSQEYDTYSLHDSMAMENMELITTSAIKRAFERRERNGS